MTLNELIMTSEKEEYSTLTMDEIYEQIKYCYDGNLNCYFRHGSSSCDDEISKRQVDQLRADGYTVEWNRACLWYEVSGW